MTKQYVVLVCQPDMCDMKFDIMRHYADGHCDKMGALCSVSTGLRCEISYDTARPDEELIHLAGEVLSVALKYWDAELALAEIVKLDGVHEGVGRPLGEQNG